MCWRAGNIVAFCWDEAFYVWEILMSRFLFATLICVGVLAPATLQADIVQDWNVTLNDAARTVTTKHNPGIPTRAMAMMNGSIYDAFQAINRTHKPFKVNTFAPGASADAAASQAAYQVLSNIYPEYQSTLDSTLATRLGAVPNGAAKTAGINLGNHIAQHYIDAHQNDGWDLPDAYTPTVGPGHWSTDPMVGPAWIQKGWGSDWGSCTSVGHAKSRLISIRRLLFTSRT